MAESRLVKQILIATANQKFSLKDIAHKVTKDIGVDLNEHKKYSLKHFNNSIKSQLLFRLVSEALHLAGLDGVHEAGHEAFAGDVED